MDRLIQFFKLGIIALVFLVLAIVSIFLSIPIWKWVIFSVFLVMCIVFLVCAGLVYVLPMIGLSGDEEEFE